jgi:pyruvate/2-oxoglutarate dehydrogenase complex dihydrolipoamide acyltransferase (E2) component
VKTEVRLPEMGEDATDVATVSYWLVEEGEAVTEGEDIIEMTTDKAAFSVPSPTSGVLIEKLVDEGDEVRVDEVICIIES